MKNIVKVKQTIDKEYDRKMLVASFNDFYFFKEFYHNDCEKISIFKYFFDSSKFNLEESEILDIEFTINDLTYEISDQDIVFKYKFNEDTFHILAIFKDDEKFQIITNYDYRTFNNEKELFEFLKSININLPKQKFEEYLSLVLLKNFYNY